jgi:hypothetical protein
MLREVKLMWPRHRIKGKTLGCQVRCSNGHWPPCPLGAVLFALHLSFVLIKLTLHQLVCVLGETTIPNLVSGHVRMAQYHAALPKGQQCGWLQRGRAE